MLINKNGGIVPPWLIKPIPPIVMETIPLPPVVDDEDTPRIPEPVFWDSRK